jgi:hypothetical protein
LHPCVSSKAAVTEKTIGNIIIAVAVLDIHMDKKADANIKPHNILKGLPTIFLKRVSLPNPFSSANAIKKTPINKNYIINMCLKYFIKTPNMGKE